MSKQKQAAQTHTENTSTKARLDPSSEPIAQPAIFSVLMRSLAHKNGVQPISAQAARLGDGRLLGSQRREAASQVGAIQGNYHLGSVLRSIPRAAKNSTSPALPNRIPPTNLVQRRPINIRPRTLVGMLRYSTAPLPAEEPAMESAEIRVVNEVVEPGARGRFSGFPNRIQALALALQQNNISAVIQDRGGQYHVLVTDRPPLAELTRHETEGRTNPQYVRIWFHNMVTERGRGALPGRESWGARVTRARAWNRALQGGTIPQAYRTSCPHDNEHRREAEFRTCVQQQFVSLLTEAMNITFSDIYLNTSAADRNPNHLINLNLYLSDSEGRGGIRELPTTHTAAAPRPYVVLGPGAFTSVSRINTIGTVVHEAEHFSHAARMVEVWERWRDYMRRNPEEGMSVVRWFAQERARGRITQTEYILATEKLAGGSANTETLAYLRGFTSIYHRHPIRSLDRFDGLVGMANFWPRAESIIQEPCIERLEAYYRTLDAPHQTDMSHQVRRQRGAGGARAPFWQRVIDDVLS